MKNNKRRKIKKNKCPEENFLSLRYWCNVKTNSVRNNTKKTTNIQQKIF